MFYSTKYNLLFIASPKTGTVSVHEALEKLDPEGERRKIALGDREVTALDMHYGVIGHARAWELKQAIGAPAYDKMETIAFIRDPYAKLVSSYFFNRSGVLSKAFEIKGGKRRTIRMVNRFLTMFIPKILPFQLWALLYPMKTNLDYVADRKGNRIVKHLGRTEFLDQDFQVILETLGIDQKGIEIQRRNTSSHGQFENYFNNTFFKKIIDRRYRADIELYQSVTQELNQLLK